MPDAEARRQRAAYRRGVWRTGVISAVILFLVGSLALLARRAEQQAAANRRLLGYTRFGLAPEEQGNISAERVEELLSATIYHTQMRLALQEWESSNIDRLSLLFYPRRSRLSAPSRF